MAGTSVEWEVESIDNEAALKIRLNELRVAGDGDAQILYNSTLSKFTIIYLKAI
jgi:hypothetical protein